MSHNLTSHIGNPQNNNDNNSFQIPKNLRGSNQATVTRSSEQSLAIQRQICIDGGGRWDSEKNKCISQEDITREIRTAQGFPTGKSETTIRDVEPFKLTDDLITHSVTQDKSDGGRFNAERGGFVADDGRFFPTTNPDFVPSSSVDSNVGFNADRTVTVSGADGNPVTLSQEEYQTFLGKGGALTNNVQQAQAQPTQQELAIQQFLSKIGRVGRLDPAEEAAINFSQALTAGAFGVAGGAAGGAAVGLLGGAGGPGGAALGAGLGSIGGFINGVIRNIQTQQRGEIGAAKQELSKATTAMRQLATLASRNPADADYYISLYNKQLTRVHQARLQTKLETSGDLNAWVEDGRTQLAEFDVFLRPGGTADIYGERLRVALATGQELSISGDELFEDENLGQ